jgi:hypothetical protein
MAQTINSKTILDAAYAGSVCAGLESNEFRAIALFGALFPAE